MRECAWPTAARVGSRRCISSPRSRPPRAWLELEAEIAALEEAATAAKTAQTAAEHELGRFTAELQAKTGSAETVQDTVQRLQTENRAHEERLESYRHTLPLKWVIPAVVVALVAGFLVGLWWLDALIRRRHGGFRVY